MVTWMRRRSRCCLLVCRWVAAVLVVLTFGFLFLGFLDWVTLTRGIGMMLFTTATMIPLLAFGFCFCFF